MLLWPGSGRLLTFRWRRGIRTIDGHEAIVPRSTHYNIGTPTGPNSPACASRRQEEKEGALAKNARAPLGVPLGPGALVDVPTIHNRMDFVDARFAVPPIESSR